VYNAVEDTSTLTYSSITYKAGWEWNPPTNNKLVAKTGNYRRTVLFPDASNLNYSYSITALDSVAQTIKVKGDATINLSPPTTFAVMYGQFVKDSILVDEDTGTYSTVKFFDQTGTNSFADGDETYDGVCEVCHTQTTHFRSDGGGSDPNHENHTGVAVAGTSCISCHPHTEGFKPNCNACHGHDAGYEYETGKFNQGRGTFKSHSTHTENDSDDLKGPNIGCNGCHDTNAYPQLADHQNMSNTTVCNTCHSPNGAFNGVSDSTIGANPNWELGIYDSNILRSGKEKWCAGCHDNVPSIVKGTTAPDIAGDNSTYGYYLDAHGDTGYGVSRQGVSYSKGECLHCHDVSQSGHGGQLFDTSVEFCLKCHDNTTTYATTAIKNRSYSYRAGNYSTDTLDSIKKAFTNSPSISSHKLSDIKTFINGKWGYDVNSNPCAACHNPHRAQGDPEHSDAAKSPSTRGYPVVRPSEHATNYNNLWGDSAGEKMSNYTNKYQAPYHFGSTTAFEPDGSSTQTGSNLTDFNTFCTDCHNTTNTIYSTTLGRNLKKIDWITSAGESGGDKHGKNVATDTAAASIHLKNPYLGVWTAAGLVLACTDCHEPHGSPNVFLLRNEVNGGVLSNSITAFSLNLCSFPGTDGNKVLGSLCNRCHKDDHDLDPSNFPTPNTWKYVHHYGSGFPYDRAACYRCHYVDVTQQPITCNCCHYHGSSTTDYGAAYPCKLYPTLCDDSPPVVIDRRTF
jgi:predicted CXXCH cytochrome family protein